MVVYWEFSSWEIGRECELVWGFSSRERTQDRIRSMKLQNCQEITYRKNEGSSKIVLFELLFFFLKGFETLISEL